MKESRAIQDVLQEYEKVSSQTINKSKVNVYE